MAAWSAIGNKKPGNQVAIAIMWHGGEELKKSHVETGSQRTPGYDSAEPVAGAKGLSGQLAGKRNQMTGKDECQPFIQIERRSNKVYNV